jgi:hypothetical protein
MGGIGMVPASDLLGARSSGHEDGLRVELQPLDGSDAPAMASRMHPLT